MKNQQMNYTPMPLPSGLRGRTHERGFCEAEGGTCLPARTSWSSPGLPAPPAPHPSPGTGGPGSSGTPVRRAFAGQQPGTWMTRAPVSTAHRASCPRAGRGGPAPCGRLWVGLSNWSCTLKTGASGQQLLVCSFWPGFPPSYMEKTSNVPQSKHRSLGFSQILGFSAGRA